MATLIALTGGTYGRAAADHAAAEARRRLLAARQAAYSHSRHLCEDLVEQLGWLEHPDDPDRVPEVAANLRRDADALVRSLARRKAVRLLASIPPLPGELTDALGVAALIDAIDAEVRVATLGEREATERAFQLAVAVRAGVRQLANPGAL